MCTSEPNRSTSASLKNNNMRLTIQGCSRHSPSGGEETHQSFTLKNRYLLVLDKRIEVIYNFLDSLFGEMSPPLETSRSACPRISQFVCGPGCFFACSTGGLALRCASRELSFMLLPVLMTEFRLANRLGHLVLKSLVMLRVLERHPCIL